MSSIAWPRVRCSWSCCRCLPMPESAQCWVRRVERGRAPGGGIGADRRDDDRRPLPVQRLRPDDGRGRRAVVPARQRNGGVDGGSRRAQRAGDADGGSRRDVLRRGWGGVLQARRRAANLADAHPQRDRGRGKRPSPGRAGRRARVRPRWSRHSPLDRRRRRTARSFRRTAGHLERAHRRAAHDQDASFNSLRSSSQRSTSCSSVRSASHTCLVFDDAGCIFCRRAKEVASRRFAHVHSRRHFLVRPRFLSNLEARLAAEPDLRRALIAESKANVPPPCAWSRRCARARSRAASRECRARDGEVVAPA
jgi:hypothetical protein